MARLVLTFVLMIAVVLGGCSSASRVADGELAAAHDPSLWDWFDDHPAVKYSAAAGVTVLALVGVAAIVVVAVAVSSVHGPFGP